MSSIFTKIIRREIPADIVYEDDALIVIRDINPQAKTHLLIIPKKEIATVNDITPEDTQLVWKMYTAAQNITKELGISDGYKLHINVGEKWWQEVMHLHMHLLSEL